MWRDSLSLERFRSSGKRASPRSGFTLLEMLLAITLLSMIVAAILGGLHMGRRAWETGKTYETVSEIEEAARAINGQLARAASIRLPGANGGQVAAFRGLPDSCRFVALSEGGAQWGGLILTEIAGPQGPGEDVALWSSVFRPSQGLEPPRDSMNRVSVLRAAANFRLSYFGEVENGRPPVWTDQWIDHPDLPLLIAVRLAGEISGRTVDVSFVVALRQR
ncbi:PulJ/GspJ family protein [Methylocystis bryophila]|nr:prepilin-type N-terminal cleavage/methylation domain-containing protein [Methylocystis bryophila]